MGVTSRRRVIVGGVLAAALLAATGVAANAAQSTPRATADVPADVLDLTNWKLQLPTGEDGKVDEVEQPELGKYTSEHFRLNDARDAVVFSAPTDGAHTGGSKYARSELREMKGSEKASWSTSEGTHTMVIKQAITHLPADRPHVVAGQVHGTSDDLMVFRLEGTKLYVTNQDDSHHKLITDSYKLGEQFEAKFVAHDGKIEAYYNGQLQTSVEIASDTAYFKAGVYPQSDTGSSHGEVVINSLTVTHS
ncbi:alginate lyase [Herbihabitans rhizosphaerae]|uniref:Alginate lyase n=1 Tax=Herbihabitans rhizosphaerae TaxID=1872711 RepID=A0A4Q7KJJ0_9PSEU|nr:polysaccharide lyase family 7 protein [Herbihabitans rhizosphaerae]RZS36595.1 alginate lyase [Herbihabitans rhizosphaerae]